MDMGMIFKRLKNRAGETLVESMVSILIFTFASIILLTMISASADMNEIAQQKDAEHLEQLILVEAADDEVSPPAQGTVTFDVQVGTGEEIDGGLQYSSKVAVDIYGSEDGLYSYYLYQEEVSAGES